MSAIKSLFYELMFFFKKAPYAVLAVVLILALFVLLNSFLVDVSARFWGIDPVFADYLIMNVSPPFYVVPAPQYALGPIALFVMILLMRGERRPSYIVRVPTRTFLWRKHCVLAVILAAVMSLILLVLIFMEKDGWSQLLSGAMIDGGNSYQEIITQATILRDPSILLIVGLSFFESFSVVLFELVLFLLLRGLTKNEMISFVSVVGIVAFSQFVLNFPQTFFFGYYAFVDFNAFRYFLPITISALCMLLGFFLYKNGLVSEGALHDSKS